MNEYLKQSHCPEIIFVEKEVKDFPWVENILSTHKNIKIVDNINTIIEKKSVNPYPTDENSLKYLLIGKQRGPFVKPCPCSQKTVRCGYYFLNIGLGCPIDCSYCFLQGFLNTSFPVLYANLTDMEKELVNFEQELKESGKIKRIGTGEMTDSLVFDPLNGYARHLIKIFQKLPHLILELKTKSTFIDSILDLAAPNIALAWSINPKYIASVEEKYAPGYEERIAAICRAVEAGYSIGIHFDPIIAYLDWQKQYYDTLKDIFSKIPVQKISWISLGTFRIFPALRDVIRKRHPHSRVLLNEMIKGYDGKLRYFKKTRIEIYKKMNEWINELGNNTVPVYLCMESVQVWKQVFDKNAQNNLLTEYR